MSADSDEPHLAPPGVSRRDFLRQAALPLLAAAASAGCGARGRVLDTLAIGIDQDVPTLDPAMHRSRTVESVIRNMFDGLVTRDAEMRVVPEIAESWRRLDDLTWEFTIRQGVRFHNGDPLTAEDAAFTIERTVTPEAIGGQSSPRKGLLGSVTEAVATGVHLLRVKTAEPYPILPKMLTFHEIVPQQHIQRVGDEQFAAHPVGAGPFRFVQHVPGERIVMERFTGYYGGSPEVPEPGPAQIERLVFLPIPEVATRLGALLASEIDIAEKVPPHATGLVQRDATTRLSACTGTRTFFVGLNCTRPPLNDLRVRQAFAHGVDIPAMVECILGGHATTLAGPLVPAAFGFDDSLVARRYDPERAKALLREAGAGASLSVELDCEDADRELAEAAAAQLSQLGVKVRPRVWKWDVLQPLLAGHERGMFLTSWGNASLDPAGILPPLFVTGGRGNYMGYSDARVDEALQESNSVFDPERRRSLFVEVQRILHREVPAIFGWAKQEIYGARKRVENWEGRPDAMLMMHRVRLAEGAQAAT